MTLSLADGVHAPQCTTKISMSVSVVCIDQVRLESCLEQLQALGVDRLHVDLIDTSFGNLGLPPEIISDLDARFGIPIDVHLMVNRPEDFTADLVARGANLISVHQRSVTPQVLDTLEAVRAADTQVGLVVDPGENIHLPLVHHLRPDRLTVMTVQPGGAGRPFVAESLATIEHAAQLRARSVIGSVEADGAIGPATAGRVIQHGADHLVLGSTVFPNRGPDGHRMAELRETIKEAS